MAKQLPSKDPFDVEPYHIIWCDRDGRNDGTKEDDGELNGATIASSAWTISPSSELTEDSNHTLGITIRGITYAANTVSTIWLSAGTHGQKYQLTNVITTSDGRTLSKTITIPVENH